MAAKTTCFLFGGGKKTEKKRKFVVTHYVSPYTVITVITVIITVSSPEWSSGDLADHHLIYSTES